GNDATFVLYLIGADMLGDTASLTRLHVLMANPVQQAGLTVVDMAEDGDNGRAIDHVFELLVLIKAPPRLHLLGLRFDRYFYSRFRLRLKPHLRSDNSCCLVINLLINAGHNA